MKVGPAPITARHPQLVSKAVVEAMFPLPQLLLLSDAWLTAPHAPWSSPSTGLAAMLASFTVSACCQAAHLTSHSQVLLYTGLIAGGPTLLPGLCPAVVLMAVQLRLLHTVAVCAAVYH